MSVVVVLIFALHVMFAHLAATAGVSSAIFFCFCVSGFAVDLALPTVDNDRKRRKT